MSQRGLQPAQCVRSTGPFTPATQHVLVTTQLPLLLLSPIHRRGMPAHPSPTSLQLSSRHVLQQHPISDSGTPRHSSSFVAFSRRKNWPDAQPYAQGKITRKALAMLKFLKPPPRDAPEAPSTSDDASLEEALSRWVKALKPERRDLLDVMRELEGPRSKESLRKVLEWGVNQDWFEPCLRDYTRLVEAQGIVGDIAAMESTVERVREAGLTPDKVVFFVLIREYSRAGMSREAEGVIETMRGQGVAPDARCYESLIAGLGRAGEMERAEAVMQRMREEGLPVSMRAHTILITGYGRNGRLEEAQRTFDAFKASGGTPDCAAHTALMLSYGKAGHLEEAVQVFRDMVVAGVPPDDLALAQLVECHRSTISLSKVTPSLQSKPRVGGAIGSRCKQAVQLVLEMEELGYAPGVSTFTALIALFAQQGLVVQAAEVFQEMKEAGIQPTPRTYTWLFEAYARAGDVHGTRRVIEMMRGKGWEPNEHNYRVMLTGLVAGGLFEEAEKLVTEAQRGGLVVEKSVMESIKRGVPAIT